MAENVECTTSEDPERSNTVLATLGTHEGREWLKTVLATTDRVKIVFTKTDGTNRIMYCTLKEGVAVPYERKTDRTRAENTDVLRVWDLEKNEWRGFRLSAVRELAFDL